MLTLGSLFNGISGWVISAEKYGVKTLWESEIDEYCEAVTKHHFSDVKQLGDITKIDGSEIEPVDIICAGSPCQDLSVAGKREGLKGERSGLFHRAIDIIRQMRMSTGGRQPRYFVWENVPGAFSSNKGLDFRAVLEEISQTEIPMPKDNKWADAGMVEWDGGSLAWRVLDAQYWGVPQRRKRIFLVADFRGYTAGEILFIEPSVSGDSQESSEARKGSSESTGTSTDSTGKCVGFNANASASDNMPVLNDKTPPLRTTDRIAIHSYSIAGNTIGRKLENGGNGKGVLPECSYTLNTTDRHAVFIIENHPNDSRVRYKEDNVFQALSSRMGTGGGNVPMIQEYSIGHDERSAQFTPNKTDPLTASDYKQPPIINAQKMVRRLTPLDFDNYLQEVDINGATKGVKALLVLRENYGTQKVCEWCTAIMERIQQAKVLQQRVYEKSISAKTTQGDKLDDRSLPCPEYIAEWLLRDMWEQQECRCSSQGWESTEQFARELNESVQELPYKNTPSKKEMCGMRETSKGTRILRETFAEIQKIWESVNVESWRGIKTVRRITPLEAERLQGLPDGYTDIEFHGKPAPDSRRYKAIGNGMAVPCSDYVIRRIVEAEHEQSLKEKSQNGDKRES